MAVATIALLLLVTSVCGSNAQNTGQQQTCKLAQLQCTRRSGCKMALANFILRCSALFGNETLDVVSTCPTDCKHAIVSLLSTEDNTGYSFMNCDCGKEKTCAEQKKKVQICQREVLESMHILKEDTAPVTCTLARWICETDISCLTALNYYYAHCNRLFKGIRCSSKCKNSLKILSRQQHANKLRNCSCDGSEDYDCIAVKRNTEEMCFSKRKSSKRRGKSSSKKSGKRKKGRGKRRSRRRKRRNQKKNKNRRKSNRNRRRHRRAKKMRKQKKEKASTRSY